MAEPLRRRAAAGRNDAPHPAGDGPVRRGKVRRGGGTHALPRGACPWSGRARSWRKCDGSSNGCAVAEAAVDISDAALLERLRRLERAARPARARRRSTTPAARRRDRVVRAVPPADRYAQGVRGGFGAGHRPSRSPHRRARHAAGGRDRAAGARGRAAGRRHRVGETPRLHPGRRPLPLGAGRLPRRGHQQVRRRLLRRPGRGADGEPAGPLGGRPGRLPRGRGGPHRLRRQHRDPHGDRRAPARPHGLRAPSFGSAVVYLTSQAHHCIEQGAPHRRAWARRRCGRSRPTRPTGCGPTRSPPPSPRTAQRASGPGW